MLSSHRPGVSPRGPSESSVSVSVSRSTNYSTHHARPQFSIVTSVPANKLHAGPPNIFYRVHREQPSSCQISPRIVVNAHSEANSSYLPPLVSEYVDSVTVDDERREVSKLPHRMPMPPSSIPGSLHGTHTHSRTARHPTTDAASPAVPTLPAICSTQSAREAPKPHRPAESNLQSAWLPRLDATSTYREKQPANNTPFLLPQADGAVPPRHRTADDSSDDESVAGGDDGQLADVHHQPPSVAYSVSDVHVTASDSFEAVPERREPRTPVSGQHRMADKAAARVVKTVFCISVTRSSRLIQFFKVIPRDILGRVLHTCCKSFAKRLDRDSFLDAIRVFTDAIVRSFSSNFSGGDSPLLGSPTFSSSMAANGRRGSVRPSPLATFASSLVASSVKLPSHDAPSSPFERFRNRSESKFVAARSLDDNILTPEVLSLVQSIYHEDTDPLFALFDEEGRHSIVTKQFRDRFFAVALATPADIASRLVLFVLASPSYHSLETSVSRFEVQMMCELLLDVFTGQQPLADDSVAHVHKIPPMEQLMTVPAFLNAIKRMQEVDREALLLFEASHPSSAFGCQYEEEADDNEILFAVPAAPGASGVPSESPKPAHLELPSGPSPRRSPSSVKGSEHSAASSQHAHTRDRAGCTLVEDANMPQKSPRAEYLRLKSNMEQTEEQRAKRLVLMLNAVDAFPNELNHISSGCLTIRELRELCMKSARYRILADESVLCTKSWTRSTRSIVRASYRFDAIFLHLVQYLETTSAAPGPQVNNGSSAQSTAMRIPSFAAALQRSNSNVSMSSSASHSVVDGSYLEDTTPTYAPPIVSPSEAPIESSDDPILAEAIRDYEMKTKSRLDQIRNPTAKSFVRKVASMPKLTRSLSVATLQSQADLYLRTSSSGLHVDHFVSDASVPATVTHAKEVLLKSLSSGTFGHPQQSMVVRKKSVTLQSHDSSRNIHAQDVIENPPEHGNPSYEIFRGQIVRKTAACPEGKVVTHW